MMPELSAAFGVSATAVASIAGLFYYGYSPFSLVAGTALDRLGPRKVVPIGAAWWASAQRSFGTRQTALASAGRFLQGRGRLRAHRARSTS
jgi:fucose permease